MDLIDADYIIHSSMPSEDNKRVAKNAVFLTFRLVLSTAVSLYTSRIVLEVLGVDNFGVYGLVGGIVALFALLNVSMSLTTSRFITFELGRGDLDRLRATFSSSFVIHLLIALAILVLGETVGLWFLNYKLNIPQDSIYAANWVYQFSILSSMMSVTQIPYTASIMAHEKMGIYAYIELVNTFLRLLIVYALCVIPGNKLIVYGALQLMVSICILMTSRIYCIRKFEEAKLCLRISKDIVHPMLSFISWNFLYTGCITVRRQGIVFLLNMFFGVAVNAAASLSSTVTGVVGGLFNNVLTAFQPQIVKNYAAGKIYESQMQTIMSFIFSSLVCSVIMLPLYFNVDFILSIWLINVPDYVAQFIRINLFILYIEVFNNSLNILVQASGKVRMPSIINGILYVLNLPFIWFLFTYIKNPDIAYYSAIIVLGIILMMNCAFVKKCISGIRIREVAFSIVRCFVSLCVSFVLFLLLLKLTDIENNWYRVLFSVILALIIPILSYYLIAFDSETRIYATVTLRRLYEKRF